MRLTTLSLLAAATLVPASLAAQAGQPGSYRLRGNAFAIYNLAGTVRIEGGGGGDEVQVRVTRGGKDGGELEVDTGPVRGFETLRVIYPEDRIVYQDDRQGGTFNHTLNVRDDGTFGDGRGGEGRGSSRSVRISNKGSGLEAWADLVVSVPSGKRVELHLAAGSVDVSNVNGDLLVDVGGASVTTTGTRGRLRLDTGSGEVRVTDANGDIELDTGSGDVTLDRVDATRLQLDAGSGGIRGTAIAADVLRLDLGSGSTRLRDVRSRDIILDSGSGAVDLDLATDIDDLRIDSGSGSVTLRIPSSLGAQLDVDTGSGGIDTEVEVAVSKRARGTLRGTIGDGRGQMVIESGSGSVRLLRRGS